MRAAHLKNIKQKVKIIMLRSKSFYKESNNTSKP